MSSHRCLAAVLISGISWSVMIGASGASRDTADQRVNGTIWVANRGAHTIRAFDAASGDVVRTVSMAPNSQPGDLGHAKGKIYVAEEFGTPPSIAIVDPVTGTIVKRISLDPAYRPHHVHPSTGGNLLAVSLFGTDKVAVIDTHDDTVLGQWDSNPAPTMTSGRVHAGVFSTDESTLYLTSDATNEVIAMDPRTETRVLAHDCPRRARARGDARSTPAVRQPPHGKQGCDHPTRERCGHSPDDDITRTCGRSDCLIPSACRPTRIC